MKTTGKIGSGAFLLLGILLSSCMHYYYVPNVQNVPLLREKNEVHLSGAFSIGEESESIEAQSAFSISDHLGITANFMSTKGGITTNRNYGKGYLVEGGIGYFNKVGESLVFEVYGGLGRSHQHHEYTSFRYDEATGVWDNYDDGKVELSYSRLFIQPAFGFNSKFLDVAFSARLCRLSYDIINNAITMNSEIHEDVNHLTDKDHFFIEPAVTVRGGWKSVKVQFQASYSGYLNRSVHLMNEEFHISLGACFTIASR